MQKLYAGGTPFEKPEPTALTKDETAVRECLQSLREEQVSLEKRLECLKQVVAEARNTCVHRAFFDTAGFEYDFRSCGICGSGLGLV